MGLDGLASSAYGPEAALTVLIPLGAANLGFIGWAMAPIIALLASYWQTIRACPNNGGADGGLRAERRGRHSAACGSWKPVGRPSMLKRFFSVR